MIAGFGVVGTAAADTVYVSDILRLVVRSDANPQSPSLGVIQTGARLEVLGKKGPYLKIRTERGTLGWVKSDYVMDQPPAQLALAELKTEHAKAEDELKTLRSQVAELETRLEQAHQDIASAQQAAEQASQKASQASAADTKTMVSPDQSSSDHGWVLWLLATLICGVIGFFTGINWFKSHVERKLGGLKI
jgi:SH3 domain protein